MQVKEREKLFLVIAGKGFEKNFYTHEEVFGDIRESPFTIKETTEYLEVTEITLRRWVQPGVIRHEKLGKNIFFAPVELKRFKKFRAKKLGLVRRSPYPFLSLFFL